MAEGTQKKAPSGKQSASKSSREQEAPVAAETAEAEQWQEGLDQILDEIDEVLEENAEEFVKSYVQKGGQ